MNPASPTQAEPIKIGSTESFERLLAGSDRLFLVDFWAEWCGPCRMLSPVLDELAAENSGKATVVKVDVDSQPELSARYQIQSLPTLAFFKGGEIAERLSGVRPKSELQAILDRLAS